MEESIRTLRRAPISYGHFSIFATVRGKGYHTITTNMPAIDAAFDEEYNEADNSERMYENRRQAQIALVVEILTKHDIDLSSYMIN